MASVNPIQPEAVADADSRCGDGVSRGESALRHLVMASPDNVTRAADRGLLAQFLSAETIGKALTAWFGEAVPRDKNELLRRLTRDIGVIDSLLNRQLNVILHTPSFQRLEATWRGVRYLADYTEDGATKLRIFNASWRDLDRDFSRALEFDQSEVFRKVYEQEFGTAGGEPFGLMIADFEVQPQPTSDHPYNDLDIVRGLAQVGTAAFCPMILNASPRMFGLDSFESMQHRVDHSQTFSQREYISWRRFRESEHARFVAFAMPRVLMRRPYADDGTRVDRFCFEEDVCSESLDKYLWGGAAFTLGEVAMRSFNQSGWLADIRGFHRDQERGGVVTGLPVHRFGLMRHAESRKSSTDVVITEELEQQLAELGFIPLCDSKDSDYSVLFSNQTWQKPKVFDRDVATLNARLSSMLQYVLCASRFAHYVKVIGRDKTGAFQEAPEFERFLHNWVNRYVTADAGASPDVKARYPLRAAQVQVFPVPGRPGTYGCTMHLSPHYELDDVQATIRLQAELTKKV